MNIVSSRCTVYLLFALAMAPGAAALADTDPASPSPGRFTQQSGEALYQAICQGCHMPDAKGARGAGRYPALAGNPALAEADYPVFMVRHGNGGMPSFGLYLSDAQTAAVVNYVRTHFGNHYTDAVSAEHVRQVDASLYPHTRRAK
ncbi:MAG: Fructose dehydrogenase cytochrome subunit [Stenotrophomonas maltophilia]|nr:MAG: Fructose dehydrogenase cytochrome subunit [Stenotrophomonas maltophilia]